MLSLLYLFFREDNIVDFSELLERVCNGVGSLAGFLSSKVLHGVVAVLCVGESLKVIHMNMCKTSLHLARDRYLPGTPNKKMRTQFQLLAADMRRLRRFTPSSTKLACLMPRAPRACEFQRSDVNPSAARAKCSHDLQCLFFASLQKGLRCRCQRAKTFECWHDIIPPSGHYETAGFALAFPRAPICRTPIM
jgi:hypothetical protein